MEETHRSFILAGFLTTSVTGGLNEFGVSAGIEFMPMKPELVNTKGVTSSCNNHWPTSLIAQGLLQGKNAREVGFNTTRSWIGEVDLSKSEFFMASRNIHTLDLELGLWREGTPFVWHDVFVVPVDRWSCLREWGLMDRLVPSRNR